MKCPHCERTDRQNKAGTTSSGRQRYLCMFCQRKYTPNPKARGYDQEIKAKAIQMYVDGMNYRRIARHLNVSHQSVYRWVRSHAERTPPPPQPKEVEIAELDEVFTFIGDKKTRSTS